MHILQILKYKTSHPWEFQRVSFIHHNIYELVVQWELQFKHLIRENMHNKSYIDHNLIMP